MAAIRNGKVGIILFGRTRQIIKSHRFHGIGKSKRGQFGRSVGSWRSRSREMLRLPWKMDQMKLRWSDIWVLLATCIAEDQEDCSLTNVIGVADGLNHAILNHEELASAMVRLEDRGYIMVSQDPWRITMTKMGIDIVAPALKQPRDPYSIRKEIETQLGATPYVWNEPIPHPENTLVYPGYSKDDHMKAVNEYLQRMKQK